MNVDPGTVPIRLSGPPRIEVLVRAVTPHGAHKPRDAILRRLRAATRSGLVESVDVVQVPKEVRRSATADDAERELAATYDRLRAWATANDCSLAPCFAERTIESEITGVSRDVIVFPIVTLVAYDRSGAVAAVVPCRADGGVYPIHQFLDDLEVGTVFSRAEVR